MSGPSYPGGYPTDPSNQPGYPQYPQQPQPPYTQPPAYPPAQPPSYPPYGQPPAYPPYAQPPKQGGGAGTVVLIVGIIAAVLIVICVGLCFALGFSARILGTAVGTRASQLATQAGTEFASAGSLSTVNSFCGAVQTQNYTTAYSYLSSSLQQQYSQTLFTQDNQNHDSTQGPVTQCSPQGIPTVTGSGATISVMVTRTLSPTPNSSGNAAPTQTASVTGQITLEQDSSGNWLITNIDSSLSML